MTELTQSRDASVDSAAAELRRIERDLHDGAQQRLVALAMDLGLAHERLAQGDDPQRAAELVDRAHEEAKQAIVELRELVRGIHPSVLTDRGLDAALSALAARSPVPVDVQIDLPRPPAGSDRGRRLLRRRRGVDQRRQAQRSDPRVGAGHLPGSRRRRAEADRRRGP